MNIVIINDYAHINGVQDKLLFQVQLLWRKKDIMLCYLLRWDQLILRKRKDVNKVMIVGINLMYLRPGQVGGSEFYIREVINELQNFCTIRIFCSKEVALTFQQKKNLDINILTNNDFSQINRLYCENIKIRKILHNKPIDILWSPANFAIFLSNRKIPQICTIHDLQYLHCSQDRSYFARVSQKILFFLTFSVCSHVISISDFTKKDLIDNYNLDETYITTVLNGVNSNQFDISEEKRTALKDKFDLPEHFFYYPAVTMPHKNHLGLLESFSKFHAQNKNIYLIFSGATSGIYSDTYLQIEEKIQNLGLGQYVKHLGYISRDEVFEVMSSAKAMVFPSEFEGFGLPLLEAMRCRTPVIASNKSSIPEIAGDAAILIDPYDIDGWVRSMQDVLHNKILRIKLQEKGICNLTRFSWKKCALETYEVFCRVVSNHK